jgi:aspartate 1-decarboxylase
VRTFVAAKIKGLKVTSRRLDYCGSQSMPPSVMRAAGIQEYEQICVANLRNGNRWVTYAIMGEEGQCQLNSAAAHQGEVGDELVVMTFRQEHCYSGGTVVHVLPGNLLGEVTHYPEAAR